jgi:hypothetical protein
LWHGTGLLILSLRVIDAHCIILSLKIRTE